MQRSLLPAAVCAALLAPTATALADDADIAELRAELDAMRKQYETRIRQLERRLSAAEQAARAAPPPAPREAVSQPMSAPSAPSPQRTASTGAGGAFGAITSGSAFNPQIAVILDGNYYQDDTDDGDGAALVGEAFMPGRGHGHAHGDEGHDHDHGGHSHSVAENGFNFREAELSFTATVDPYFDAAAYISIDGDGNVELEEAYFDTRSLPWGLKVKGGKFLSDFGYINNQHPHQWDFVDQNLPYLNLLGFHGLQDTGLQLSWVPDLPFYARIGGEALQGNQEIFGATLGGTEQTAFNLGSTNTGPRLYTAFAKVAPDLGDKHALQFGVSYAYAEQHQEVHSHTHAVHDDHGHDDHDHDEPGHDDHDHDDNGHDDHDHGHDDHHDHGHDDDHEHADEHHDDHDEDHGHGHGDGVTEELHQTGLAGNADLWGIDLVYKYDAPGAYGQGDLTFQTEYLRSTKDLSIRSSAHPEQIGSRRKLTTDGLYAQATYGFLPRWKAGLRYDVLGLTNKVRGGGGESFGSSDRWTLDVTWNLSHFSQLRAQYAYNDILVSANERERFNAFYVQFLMSMGSHGAHKF